MGTVLGRGTPQPMPMPMVLKRLNEQIVPDDKVNILNLVEMIDIALSHKKTGATAAVLMKELQGMKLLLRILKRMLEDAEMVAVSMQVFELIKFNTPLVMDFIQFGGLDLLEKAMRMHVKDDFISVTSPKLFSVLSGKLIAVVCFVLTLVVFVAIGAGVSRTEIENEGLNLQLCQRCQETIERSKKKDYFEACVVIPRSSERASRVLKFMDNYISREDVQIAGLDAIINFVRNSDGKSQTKETNLVDVLGRVLKAHPDSTEIVWRACMVLTIVVSFHGELAYDVANLEIHDTLIDAYPRFETTAAVQQQILWLLASYLEWPKSKKVIHRSEKCVKFFKELTKALDFTEVVAVPEKKDTLAETLRKGGLIPTAKQAGETNKTDKTPAAAGAKGKADPKASATAGGKPKSPKAGGAKGGAAAAPGSRSSKPDKETAGKAAAASGKAANLKGDAKVAAEAVEEAEVEVYVRKEFELVIPLRIRTFLRETKGEVLIVKETLKEKKNFKQRRNFDERPKFGTVEDRLFVGGSEGLIPNGPENEDGEKVREIPDWEKRLNYGEPDSEINNNKKKKKPAAK